MPNFTVSPNVFLMTSLKPRGRMLSPDSCISSLRALIPQNEQQNSGYLLLMLKDVDLLCLMLLPALPGDLDSWGLNFSSTSLFLKSWSNVLISGVYSIHCNTELAKHEFPILCKPIGAFISIFVILILIYI